MLAVAVGGEVARGDEAVTDLGDGPVRATGGEAMYDVVMTQPGTSFHSKGWRRGRRSSPLG